ncbi:MAG: hypothetical protein JO167_06270 [Alphaproteobacteria bacterium]|nr:hypothetical protein [Alphaproteobacteria bacterium]MBV9540856.1 hypothetical protein [Alphaproteobacteria bacterium]MBV9902952.1 hypothetical protein [Alphaproteobacteria bacterium]
MRTFLIAASVLTLAAAPAFAGDEVMAGYYGNTVIGTSQMGESHTHYKADHTFDVALSSPMGSFTGKGTWKIDGANLCRTYEQPPPGLPNPFCIPAEAHKPGDKWTVTYGGQSRDVTMVEGIK